MMVDAPDAINAITRVLRSASIMFSSFSISAYQCREKPVHLPMDLPLLKESTISVMIGAYKKMMIRIR